MENFEVKMTSIGSEIPAIRLKRSKIVGIGFWITKNGWTQAPNSSSTEMALMALKASLKLNSEKNASEGKTSCRNGFRMLKIFRNDLRFTFTGCTLPNVAPKLIWLWWLLELPQSKTTCKWPQMAVNLWQWLRKVEEPQNKIKKSSKKDFPSQSYGSFKISSNLA